MAIRRQKLDRNANLTLDSGRVVDMPPAWTFTIDCPHHGKIELTSIACASTVATIWPDRCAMLSGACAMSFRAKPCTAMNSTSAISGAFLMNCTPPGAPITRLDQIDRTLVDRYLAWLELQVVTTGRTKGQLLSLGAKKSAFAAFKALLTNRQKAHTRRQSRTWLPAQSIPERRPTDP